jgi:glycogen synthase
VLFLQALLQLPDIVHNQYFHLVVAPVLLVEQLLMNCKVLAVIMIITNYIVREVTIFQKVLPFSLRKCV